MIAKFSNFWNMMATSIIQMLVSWYDSGIFWYTVVFCAVYTESFFTFWTPEIWWQLPVFRCWCRDMILGTFQCIAVLFTVWTISIFTLETPATQDIRVGCKILQFLYKIWWQVPVIRRWYRAMILVSFDTLWCSMQSPSSHSEHLQHGHPCSLQNYLISKRWWRFFAFRCRYRDMILRTFRYTDVVYRLNKVHLPILNSKLLTVSKYIDAYAI